MQTISSAYPRLVVRGATEALAFYRDVFGADPTERHTDDAGRVVHAEMVLAGARLAVKDEDDGDPSPASLGGTPVVMAVELADPDGVAATMLARGATVIHPITDHPYGRAGRLADPFGHQWMLLRPSVTGR
ncbi:glyoxalase/bleomycin resistance/extradiol dioxygenase family protein [Frankia sp. AgB32]|uniref:VOC family protein n=1 Tax=Frankia sp. AgB32 TaxID=631119 RepID=UPI00200BCEF8|nr:VOC family protein [Frankia sp. AgB32]MCK9897134.1 VOC family protein [Frankia sp. AgB32]